MLGLQHPHLQHLRCFTTDVGAVLVATIWQFDDDDDDEGQGYVFCGYILRVLESLRFLES